VTAWLAGVAVLFQLALGYLVAVASAMRRRTQTGRVLWWMAIIATAVPIVVSAYAFRSYLTVAYQGLGWFPFRYEGTAISLVLPLVAVVLMVTGPVVLLLRSELIESLSSAFARFEAACGFSERRIVARYVSRPCAGVTLGYVSANLGYLMTGVIIVETIYGVPGLGGLVVEAISRRDRAVVVGGVLVISFVVIVVGAITDMVAGAVDPRLRIDAARVI
jgi:oligopeptide transport system permease protein